MESSERPVVHALVCCFSPAFGIVGKRGLDPDGPPDARSWPKLVTLEEAVNYALAGFAVLVDPQDQEDLQRHEQYLRSIAPKRKWFDASWGMPSDDAGVYGRI